jgi:hypothetical protein
VKDCDTNGCTVPILLGNNFPTFLFNCKRVQANLQCDSNLKQTFSEKKLQYFDSLIPTFQKKFPVLRFFGLNMLLCLAALIHVNNNKIKSSLSLWIATNISLRIEIFHQSK